MSGQNEICATYEERMKTFIRLVLYIFGLHHFIGLWPVFNAINVITIYIGLIGYNYTYNIIN